MINQLYFHQKTMPPKAIHPTNKQWQCIWLLHIETTVIFTSNLCYTTMQMELCDSIRWSINYALVNSARIISWHITLTIMHWQWHADWLLIIKFAINNQLRYISKMSFMIFVQYRKYMIEPSKTLQTYQICSWPMYNIQMCSSAKKYTCLFTADCRWQIAKL